MRLHLQLGQGTLSPPAFIASLHQTLALHLQHKSQSRTTWQALSLLLPSKTFLHTNTFTSVTHEVSLYIYLSIKTFQSLHPKTFPPSVPSLDSASKFPFLEDLLMEEPSHLLQGGQFLCPPENSREPNRHLLIGRARTWK